MRRGNITPLLLSVLSVVALVALATSGAAAALGLEFLNVAGAEADLQAALDEQKQQQARCCDGLERSEAMDRVIDRLIAGERTLAEAADELEAINNGRPGFLIAIDDEYPNVSLRERFARLAIMRVEKELHDDPSRAAAVLPRLETELHALLAAETR